MATLTIECLSCGEQRSNLDVQPVCPRCGYVGWARSDDLDERMRRVLRERPLELRRIRAVA